MPSIVLFQPDIPQNTGAIMRLCACFNVPLVLIEPLGFLLDDKKVRRSVMDYGQNLVFHRMTWPEFLNQNRGRLILATTKGASALPDFQFQKTDALIFGSESHGVPDDVHQAAEARVFIPMATGARSLNLAISVGIVVAEALRQTGFTTDGLGR